MHICINVLWPSKKADELFFEITVKIENNLNSAEIYYFSENIQFYSKNSGSYMPDIQGCYNKICLIKNTATRGVTFCSFCGTFV